MKSTVGSSQDAEQPAHIWRVGRFSAAAVVQTAILTIALVFAACGGKSAAGDDSPLQATSQASIHFPQRTEDRDDMDALLIGELVLDDGCLYVDSSKISEDDQTYLVIWPFTSELRASNGATEIRDGSNQAVLRVGDLVRVGGGEVPSVRSGSVPDACHGPYWIASPGLARVDPVEATLEARAATPFGVYLHRREPGDRGGIDPGVLSGKLVEVDDCLRVTTNDGSSYLIIWPPDYSLDATPNVRVLDAGGRVVAQVGVGNDVRLTGGNKEILGRDLAGHCSGPYWIVEEEPGIPEVTEEPTHSR